MDEDDEADIVWDRACDLLLLDIPGVHEGDRLLAAAIHLDGTFCGSGADAMPELDERERLDGVAGLRLLGLDAAADIIEDYVAAARRGKRSSRRELKATKAYNALDVDEQMIERVRLRLEETPGVFAPADLPRPSRP